MKKFLPGLCLIVWVGSFNGSAQAVQDTSQAIAPAFEKVERKPLLPVVSKHGSNTCSET